MSASPLILWFRRDLRLDDNPMLAAAARTGRPLIPVFVCDHAVTGIGAAARWRWGEGVAAFADRLAGAGLRLVLRRGAALPVLQSLIAETGAGGVWWTRLYDPFARARDAEIKDHLRSRGLDARSFAGFTLREPWEVTNRQGDPYKVYSPFFRALDALGVAPPDPAPEVLRAPRDWPASEGLADWHLGAAMRRGATVLARHARVGEVAARDRLDTFLRDRIRAYRDTRDHPDRDATSGLSENLTLGEVSARRIWHAAAVIPGEGALHFRKELAWRDFAWHLMYHWPQLDQANWKPDWDRFPWRGDSPDAEAWRRGQTGEPLVDAGMRQLYATGTMHNRVRMIAASYLTKHLLTHWKIGLDWFADCLTDWDAASNAMGWQWVAGSGPDAAPYFRVFNPATQAEKFDSKGRYRRKFLSPGASGTSDFLAAVPLSWDQSGTTPPPRPLVDLAEGRARALAALEGMQAG